MVEIMVPEELLGSFNGVFVLPGDSGYDTTRAVHNGLGGQASRGYFPRRLNVADVRDAVNFGRDAGLEISLRGGGHNPAGRAVTEAG